MTDIFDPILQFALFAFLSFTLAFNVRPGLQVVVGLFLTLLELLSLFWPIRIFVPSAIGDPLEHVTRAGTVAVCLLFLVLLYRQRQSA